MTTGSAGGARKVLVVSSSPPRDGNSRLLADAALAGAREAGHCAELAHLDDHLGAFLRDCRVCRTHTRAYTRHLFASGEINAARLATFHNVYFYVKMMGRMRRAIIDNEFDSFKRDFLERYMEGE